MTNKERLQIILVRFGLLAASKKCELSFGGGQIHMNQMFSNLPNWSTNSTGAGSFQNVTIPINRQNVTFDFAFQGSNNCQNCISPNYCDRDLPGGRIAFDFVSCGNDCGSGLTPCMTIYFPSTSYNIVNNFFNATNYNCQ